MRKTDGVKFIKPETICIGDTIRVTRKHKDVTISEVGVVADRQVYTHSTEYTTAKGHVLYEHWRYQKNNATVTLLVPSPGRQSTLEGLAI